MKLFTRILFALGVMMIGFVIGVGTWFSLMVDEYIRQAGEAMDNENYEFFLDRVTLHSDGAIYESRALGDNGYYLLIYEIAAFERVDQVDIMRTGLALHVHYLGDNFVLKGETDPLITFYCGAEKNEVKLTVYDYESVKYLGSELTRAQIQGDCTSVITAITIHDGDGALIFDSSSDVNFTSIDLATLAINIVLDYEGDDYEAFAAENGLVYVNFTDALMTPPGMYKIYLNLSIYAVFVILITWFLFFRKKKYLGKQTPTAGFTQTSPLKNVNSKNFTTKDDE